MFWNKYPYTDFHELNLDMILQLMKELHAEWDEFTAVNKITNAGAWDITKQYQAWTVVSDNNVGYISLKPVPAGVAITNTDYWGLVADYDILITDLSSRISALEADIPILKNNDTELYSAASNLSNNDKAKIILIGDSYLAASGSVTNYGDQLRALMPEADIYAYGESGAGFSAVGSLGNTFEGLLNRAISDHTGEYINHVIVIGGSNDRNANQTYVKTFIGTWVGIAKTAFPMAKISIGMCGWTNMSYGSTDKLNFLYTKDTYKSSAISYNIAYIDGIENVMHDYSNFYDAGHPNTALQGKIAAFIHQYIKNGYAIERIEKNSTVTLASGVTLNTYSLGPLSITSTRRGDHTYIRVHNIYTDPRNYGQTALDLSLPANSETFKVADITDGLIYGVEDTNIGAYAVDVPVFLGISGGTYITFPASFFIANGGLYCSITQQGLYPTNNITYMKINPFEIVMPTDFC